MRNANGDPKIVETLRPG